MILSQWMAARGGVASNRSRFVTPAFAAVLYCLATAAVAEAPVDQPVKLNPDIPMTLTVQPGDTLWGVAAIYLRDPWRWRELWSENLTFITLISSTPAMNSNLSGPMGCLD